MRAEDAATVTGPNVIQEFEAVWRARAEGLAIPAAQAINPSEIARLMPHLMLLEVEGGAAFPQFRTKLVGAAHRHVTDAVHPGSLLHDVDAEHAERARVAAETGQPVYWRSAEHDAVSIGDFPFASDGEKVDRIVSVVVGGEKRRFFFG